MPKPNEDPITVIVTEGRWDVIDEPTPRKLQLTKLLTAQGGISDTVAPGTYHYNVKVIGGKLVATLDPA